MADTLAVANRFLDLAEEHGDTITPMQLIKLVYIAHGWMLGLYGRPLINDRIEAWQYGPVIPRLYRAVREFGSNPVDKRLRANGDLDVQADDVVRQAYERYGHLSGPQLSRMTHAAGSPWARSYHPDTFGAPISNDIIEDFYSRKVAAA